MNQQSNNRGAKQKKYNRHPPPWIKKTPYGRHNEEPEKED